jgi:hypothetical protein
LLGQTEQGDERHDRPRQEGGHRREVLLLMSYDVHYLDTQTGERRVQHFDLPWTEGSIHWHTEGNFGCDCNRGSAFFPDEDIECNLELKNRFVIELIEGEGVYKDCFEDLNPGNV